MCISGGRCSTRSSLAMLVSASSVVLLIQLCRHAHARRGREAGSESHASEEGAVGSGNYTYYTLGTTADSPVVLTILLHCLEGDADLYVGGRNKQPTFDVEEHSFQSTTCGNEVIVVPAHFVREHSPVVIGVYGHPRFNVSRYYLEVLWEAELRDEPDKNSYEDGAGQRIGDQADEGVSKQKTDDWKDFFRNAVFQVLTLVVEILLS